MRFQVAHLRDMLARISPDTLFQEATIAILTPEVRSLGPILFSQTVGLIPNPLPLAQSLLLIWPQVVGLLALMAILFAIAYIKSIMQEIQAL